MKRVGPWGGETSSLRLRDVTEEEEEWKEEGEKKRKGERKRKKNERKEEKEEKREKIAGGRALGRS